MKLDRLLKDKIKRMFYKKCKKMSKKSDEVLRPVSIDVKTILKAIRKSAKLLPWFVYLVEMAVEIVAGRYIPFFLFHSKPRAVGCYLCGNDV